MRAITFLSLFSFGILPFLLGNCAGNSSENPQDSVGSDQEVVAQNPYSLNSLLDIANEVELRKKYGNDKVRFDTIWGAEGFFTMGTILKTEPESHIEITWQNEETKTGIISVTLVSDQDWYADSISSGRWTAFGQVILGMSIWDLEKVNGHPFTIAGFGWDYAGHLISWQSGNLDGKGITVQVAEAPASLTWTPEQNAQVLGDVEVQSDNPLLKELRPRVWTISVAKVQ